MARRSPLKLGLALTLALVITHAHAVPGTCKTGCHGTAKNFKYAPGTTYKYAFDSKVELVLSSAEGQKVATEVKADVLLTPGPQCNHLLKVHNIQVIGNDAKKHSHIPDIDKPIRFNFNDGSIDDQICITPGDTQNSLNVKRAIASLFQTNTKNGHEVDVFGQCATDVATSKEGALLVLTKSRNLNRCAYRENIRRDFLSSPFNVNSEIKSSPLLNADYLAKQKIKNGVLESVIVTENYLYMPFSVGQNGAKAQVTTSLKLTGTGGAPVADKGISQPRSIIFEDPHPVNSPHINVNSILSAVKEVAKTIGATVGDSTAKEFINLIKILRLSNKDDTLAVYNQVRAGVGFADKATAKKIFLDALLRAGNGDNIVVAIELLKNKELGPIEERLVYLGLSLVRHTTLESLNSAAGLLAQPHLPREAYLGIGTLAGKYCRQHSCEKVDAINKLTQKLVQKLGDGKAANRQDENDIIYVLKALRNIHHLDDGILAKITSIAQDKKQPNRLRAVALETYLADPCKDKLRDSALSILKDIQQDSEVRIRAYLAAVQCANTKVGNAIKALIEKEPSLQVGGFIVSHIRSARSSANPDKQLIKQYLGGIILPKRFPFDLRKWSANGEFSYSIDTLGLANSVESNVIYSQNSFLPRATTLNLTAEVFGHSLNFLEIETRQENLDRLIEHYLGPKGLLRTSSLQELWDTKGKSAEKVLNELKERIERTLRMRRDLSKSEIDAINKQVQIKTNELNKDLDLDASIKAFGSELLFLNINDDASKFTPSALIDQIINGLNNGLNSIKNFEETLRSNLLFLDVDLTYPSSAGFPLRLAVEGAANLQLKASGAIDVRALFKKDTTVKVSLIPSANIEVSGRLTVDTGVVENGLKVITNLHTATGGDLIVELLKNGVDVKFALPIEKQNIISAKHNIVSHTREQATPEHNTPLKFAQNKDFDVCIDQLSPFIGLTFCAEVQLPNLSGEQVPILPFPLAGAAKLAVNIQRDDISQYHYRHVIHSESNKLGVEINIETLDNNKAKKVALDVEAFIAPEKVIKASLTSPITSASLEGRITESDAEKSVSLKLVQDKQEYFGKLGVGISGSANKKAYKPLVQYKTPQDSSLQVAPYRVEGQVIVEHNGDNVKYIFDNVKIVIPEQKTIAINGNIARGPKLFSSDITVSDGTQSGTVKGLIDVSNQLKYNLEVSNSLNPDVAFRLKGELSKSNNEHTNFLQIVHGKDLSSKTNIITLNNRLVHKRDELFETQNSLTYPALGASAKLDFTCNQGKVIKYNVDVQYADVKVGSNLDVSVQRTDDGINYNAALDVWALNNRLEAKSERKIIGPAESRISNSLQINGKKFESSGKVKHLVRPKEVDVGVDIVLKSPSHPNPLNVVAGLKLNPTDLDTHLKVSSGATVHADAFLKANKAGNANGSIKVNLRGDVIINGQVKAIKGNGNGDLTIEVPQAKRTVKWETSFNIHAPTYNLDVTLYPNFAADKNQKVSFSTQTKASTNALDSKNLVDIFGHKLEANVKGTCNGEWVNGKTSLEADLTLPNQQYLASKWVRNHKVSEQQVHNGDLLILLEHRSNKNTPGSKFSLKGILKNTNLNERTLDLSYDISAERSNGQNIVIDLALKRKPEAGADTFELYNKLSGSLLHGHPLETTLKGSRHGFAGNYELKNSCPKHNIVVKGSYDLNDSGKPLSGDLQLELSLQDAPLKTLKVSTSGSLKKNNQLAVQGQAKVYADGPEGVLIDLDTQGQVSADDKSGLVKGSLKSNKIDPIALEAKYNRVEEKDSRQLQANVDLKYGQGQNVKAGIELNKLPNHEYKLQLNLDTPLENLKSSKLQVHGKRTTDNTKHQNEITLTTNGKTWTVNTNLQLSQVAPSIHVTVKCPQGKRGELLYKVTKVSDHHIIVDLKLVNEWKNFDLTLNLDSKIESADSFHIKATANSPALKWNNIVAEAQNKPSQGARNIQVNVKSNNENILTGSTSLTSREEQGKLIIEGSGTFKVKNEQKSATFKYIRSSLTQDKNGETGIEISFDAGLGNQAIDAEFKLTNKQFRLLNSYCEEKKQCAHIEIDAKTNLNDLHHFNQEIEVAIDLRKLGLSHEFGLKAVTNRKEWILDHTVDVHFQSQAQNKYQYSLYVHPREAGASLSTPKRTIAVEGKINAPSTLLKDGGKLEGQLALYLDKKNEAGKKSAIIGYLNVDPKGNRIDGEVKFTNPALQRPLSVSFNSKYSGDVKREVSTTVIVDIFAQPNQKVVITTSSSVLDPRAVKTKLDVSNVIEIKSEGLGINIRNEETLSLNKENWQLSYKYLLKYANLESLAKLEASPSGADLVLRLANADLLKINAKIHNQAPMQHILDVEVASDGVKTAVVHVEIKNWDTLKASISRKETPNDKLLVNAGLIFGQVADLRGEVTKNGKTSQLGHATIKLDEANFLKTDYALNAEDIKNLVITPAKNDIYNHAEHVEKLGGELVKRAETEVKQLKEKSLQAIPNLTPLSNYYVNELKQIKDEIVADKTIQEVSEFLANILAAGAQVLGDAFAHLNALIENIAKSLQKTFGKVWESLEKEWPHIKAYLTQQLEQIKEIIKKATDIVLLYVAQIIEIAAKFQPELKQLTTILGEVAHDIGSVLTKLIENIRVVVIEQWRQVYNELKQMPAVEQLRAEYDRLIKEGLPTSESFINTLRDIVNTVKDLAPTEELKALVAAIGDYAEKKLSRQQVDDAAAIDRIVKAALAVVHRLTAILSGHEQIPLLKQLNVPLPINLLNKLPRLAAVRFSPLAYILNEDLPVPTNFLLSLINHPRNWIAPFPLHAVVAQGQHIFTFDGKHLTFPGKCNYLLVRDALDGNFSVIGSYENGQLAAITLAEDGDAITVKSNGQVLINNAVTQFPARRNGKAAFYTSTNTINLKSDSGIHIRCNAKLFICSVTVSGFYHGKLRGLLGNGNNEPYDDFALANGKIVATESEFANSYKTQASCANVSPVDHHHHGALPEQCKKVFGWESSLSLCYPFVDVDNYKTACAHGIAAGVKDTEQAIAQAYVIACRHHNIPVSVPSELVRCTNGAKPTEIGDKFTTKTPSKSADIILIVDTIKKNEPVYKELIQPLVVQLTSELAGKGVNDVQFHLMTYGGENLWPSHVTVNGKLQFKGEAPALKFSEAPKEEKLVTGCKRTDQFLELLRSIGHDLKLAFGANLQAETYSHALAYPFRAEALKSIIVVNGNSCEVGRFLPLQILRTLLYRSKTVNLNLITPFEKLTVETKSAKDVVGFNNDQIFALKGKSKESLKDLEYNDYCVDFTLQNDGNVFVLDNFLNAKGGERGQFVQATSKNIVDGFIGVEQTLECECKLINPIAGQNVCRVVSSKDKHSKKV